MAKRPITIQLEPDLIEEIDQAAQRTDVSRQEWIAAACRSALARQPSKERSQWAHNLPW